MSRGRVDCVRRAYRCNRNHPVVAAVNRRTSTEPGRILLVATAECGATKGVLEMKYLVQWTAPQESTRRAAERFLQTGGKPPDGVTQLGRWFGMNGNGCSVVEAVDPKGVFSLISEWQEFMH